MKPQIFRRTASDSVNKKILRAAVVIGVLTLVTRAGTIVKELIVARSFGRSDAFDAFLIAFLLPSFVVTIVSGTLGSALVPVFIEVQEKKGRDSAERLLSSISLISAIVLAVISLFLGLFAPNYLPYLAHGFSPEKLRLTCELLYVLLPWVVLSGTAQLITYILNAGERFALPALVPLATPLLVIGFVMVIGRSQGAIALSAGSLTGSALEATFLVSMLRAHGMRLRSWMGADRESVRNVLTQSGPLLAGAFLMASIPVVSQSLAATLPAGSVSALAYANRLIGGITALGATALSTATLPYFSRMAVEKDWAACRHTLKRYSTLLLVTTVPFTLFVMALSRYLIKLLYQRGAFTAADTDLVARLQIFLAVQIPFVLLTALFVRFISAIRRNHLLTYVSVINLTVNIVLSLTLMRIWGVAGIAVSISTMYIVSFLFLAGCTISLLARKRLSVLSPLPVHDAHN